jgi:hypothetical protein
VASLAIPQKEIARCQSNLTELSFYWHEELPLRIHSRDTDDSGSPQWHSDFARWLLRADVNDDTWSRNPDSRVACTRAFRLLRRRSIREYEVLYRTVALGLSVTSTMRWMNERAERNDLPDRFTETEVVLMLIIASDKVMTWMAKGEGAGRATPTSGRRGDGG